MQKNWLLFPHSYLYTLSFARLKRRHVPQYQKIKKKIDNTSGKGRSYQLMFFNLQCYTITSLPPSVLKFHTLLSLKALSLYSLREATATSQSFLQSIWSVQLVEFLSTVTESHWLFLSSDITSLQYTVQPTIGHAPSKGGSHATTTILPVTFVAVLTRKGIPDTTRRQQRRVRIIIPGV